MSGLRRRTLYRQVAVCCMLAVLAGCASVDLDQTLSRTNTEAADFTEGKLILRRTVEDHTAHEEIVAALLAEPLGQKEAVRLALMNSPALQALLARNWADLADSAQTGRISNPLFSFEHVRFGDELDIGRMLSFGLLDLLLLPQRYQVAQGQIEAGQIRFTGEVVDQVTRVRQGWVHAVAAEQRLGYAEKVSESAEAGAELARRMEAVGNFNKLSRARYQVFYADAVTQLAVAQHEAVAAREALVQLLGLTEVQALKLQLPERLPDLPVEPLQPEVVGRKASQERLDIRLARTSLDAAARAQGLNLVTSMTDIELGIRRDTRFDNAERTRTAGRGYEVSVRLPVFDWGDMQREAMNTRTLAAASQMETVIRAAGSNLRETYSAYRTGYDIARHYHDEIIPLRKKISEENMLRYNGMLISVFDLLADMREQIEGVVAAINAEQQFWLADAALQAAMIGRPVPVISAESAVRTVAGGGSDATH